MTNRGESGESFEDRRLAIAEPVEGSLIKLAFEVPKLGQSALMRFNEFSSHPKSSHKSKILNSLTNKITKKTNETENLKKFSRSSI
jgi:hypothetical protein